MPLNGQYLYPQTVAGLMQCLAMGLPFAKGTICGDILMTTVYLAIAGTLVSWKTEKHPVAAE